MLDDIEEDAIKEIFNVSLGHAIPTLSEMVDAEIVFGIPCLEITPTHHLIDHISELVGSSVCVVHMDFDLTFNHRADIPGKAFLLFRADATPPLLDALYGEHVPEAMQNQVCQETITDVSDLLLYTCISTLSSLLDSGLAGEKPQFFMGNVHNLSLDRTTNNLQEMNFLGEGFIVEKSLINLRMDLSIPARKVAGSVLIWLNSTDSTNLKEAIQQFIITRTL